MRKKDGKKGHMIIKNLIGNPTNEMSRELFSYLAIPQMNVVFSVSESGRCLTKVRATRGRTKVTIIDETSVLTREFLGFSSYCLSAT